MKTDFNKTAIWYDSDMFKAAVFGAVVGFMIGLGIGYDLGYEPVVRTVNYLVG